ncbi:hypothetical protein M9Y10_022838 [Tritrichomonas musculus]|uniref:Protein kinase domain-containing protein n=1 Tax=Tritrichomonas musculus TaxID=1915356 RepID=A0ABR2KTM0_9EUKA
MSNERDYLFKLNGYRFDKLIGVGTYSKAFKVYSVQYDKYFCAKMTEIDDSYFDECNNPRDPELLALLNLDNPNIIKVYDYFRYEDFFCLILEWCECGTLMDRLNNKIPLNTLSIKVIMKDILSALVACHCLNIAHRDIKPSNIFIDTLGRAKVADFGLSEILQNRQSTVDVACGSPSYAAPEIYGDAAYDPFKADVWSLGVTFYQMAFGQLPWPDEITLKGPERPTPPFPQNADPNLVSIIQQMLSIEPQFRPSMSQIEKYCYFSLYDSSMETDRFRRKKSENSIRSTISLRNVSLHQNANLSEQSSNQGKHMVSAISRLKSLHPQLDRSRRSSAKIVAKPLTFLESDS